MIRNHFLDYLTWPQLCRSAAALLLTMCICMSLTYGGDYKFSNGTVSFKISAPAGDLEATDQGISGSVDPLTGRMLFKVVVDQFRFVTPFMPDYINTATTKRFSAYYLETDKYPDAYFEGKINDNSAINFKKDGTYHVLVDGFFTIHGVRQAVSERATLVIQGGVMALTTSFPVVLSDYKIRVPESLRNLFFKDVQVSVACMLQQ